MKKLLITALLLTANIFAIDSIDSETNQINAQLAKFDQMLTIIVPELEITKTMKVYNLLKKKHPDKAVQCYKLSRNFYKAIKNYQLIKSLGHAEDDLPIEVAENLMYAAIPGVSLLNPWIDDCWDFYAKVPIMKKLLKINKD